MDRVPVTSSNIASVGWQPGDWTNGILEVEFVNGAVYQYTGVSRETFEALRDASSVGRYFGENIKGQYPYVRIS